MWHKLLSSFDIKLKDVRIKFLHCARKSGGAGPMSYHRLAYYLLLNYINFSDVRESLFKHDFGKVDELQSARQIKA